MENSTATPIATALPAPRRRSHAALTLACVAVALAASWALRGPLAGVHHAVPLACVAVLALVAGRGAGLIASAAIAAALHWGDGAARPPSLGDPEALRTLAFLLGGVVVSAAAGARRRARAELAAERHAATGTHPSLRATDPEARLRAAGLQRTTEELNRVEAERRHADEVRAATQRHYDLLARHSRDAVLLVRREDGRILEANAAATATYGYTRDELLALTVKELRSLDTQPLAAGQMAEADVRGTLFETVHRRKDGSVFPVEVSSQGATIDGTRTLVSVVRDITQRKRAEEALRQNELRLRGMFDNAALGIVEVDADDRFVAANGRVCDILGYRCDELIGMSVHELTAPVDRARSDDMNARLHRGPQDVIDYEKRYQRRDGTPVWVRVTVSAVRDASGTFVRGVGTVEDISERKAAEADRERLVSALRDADRKKDEFLGVLSHELRNPLAPIRSAVWILKHAQPGAPQALRAREIIERQTIHMTRLVDDLLDVTRIARGKVELRRTRVNLAEVVRRTGEDHRSLMVDRGITFALDVPHGARWVNGDGTRLAQIVGNLLQNAAKFTHRGGRVTLALRPGHRRAEIAVRDTGVGIDEALLGRVFDPFVQAERTLARSSGGLGLGLALVKGLAELHGGTVSADSGGPGRGSEFRVEVPLLSADAETSDVAHVAPGLAE